MERIGARSLARAGVLVAALALCASPAQAQPARPRGAGPTIVTGFDAAVDGLPFMNNGDYLAPGGNCWGMSLLAIDNFLRRVAAGPEASTAEPAGPITRSVAEGHLERQAAASLLQSNLNRRDYGTESENPRLSVADPAPLRAALRRIARTGVPEVLVFDDRVEAHSVVLHGYRDGALRLYDPNFPGEELRWPWSPARGFGPHPRADEVPLYGRLTHHSVTPYSQFQATTDLARVREACARREPVCMDRFAPLSVRAVLAADAARVTVSGTVGEGLLFDDFGNVTAAPDAVWIVSDGAVVGSASLDADRSFEVTLPPGALRQGGALRVVALARGELAGFADAPLEPSATSPRPPASRGLAAVVDG